MAESSTRSGRLGPHLSLPETGGHGGLRRPRMSPVACPWAVSFTVSAGSESTGAGHSGLPGLVWFQGFQLLTAAHSALEEEYLKACREHHLVEQLAGSKGTPGKFDPGRYLLGREPGGTDGAGPVPSVTSRGTPCPHNLHTKTSYPN